MICFPNAKINLGLRVGPARPDGYHDLETVFFPVPVHDILEAVRGGDQIKLELSGISIPGSENDNLLIRAWKLLNDHYNIGGVKAHLHKIIPTGAGLGGGSSDAAFFIGLMNDLFELNLTTAETASHALELGSDCPFFIHNVPSLGKGRGDMLSPVEINLKGYYYLIVCPPIHIDTRNAFRALDSLGYRNQRFIIPNVVNISEWKNELVNDFERCLLQEYPELARVKSDLYNAGAVYASLTGSGSALYGIFRSAPKDSLSGNYRFFSGKF